MKKILPLPDIPTETLIYNASYSTVVSNIPTALDWQCINCLKLFIEEPNLLNFPDVIRIDEKTPLRFVDKKYIKHSDYFTLISDRENIIDFIRGEIDQGRHVYLYFEQYYVPGLAPYQKYFFDHDGIIYGYDDDSREFFMKTYTDNKKFDSVSVDYDIMVTAIIENHASRQGFISCLPIEDDFVLTIEDLYRYFTVYGSLAHNADNKTEFNSGIYETLTEQIAMTGKWGFDYRIYRLLYEHTKCLRYIINRTAELIPGTDLSDEKTLAENCEKSADILFKLVIKYNLTYSDKLKFSITERLRSVYETESELTEKLTVKLRLHMEEKVYA